MILDFHLRSLISELIFSGRHRQHIWPDEGFEGVLVAQAVAVGAEPAEEVRKVGR